MDSETKLLKAKESRCFGTFACILEENAETLFKSPDECPAMKDCACRQGIQIGKEVKVF